MTVRKQMEREMERHGFVLEATGGGCEAFIRWAPKTPATRTSQSDERGSVWVTGECDPSIPESWDEPVDVGVYVGEYADENVLLLRFPNLRAFLDTLPSLTPEN